MDKPMRRRVRGIAVIWLVVTALVLIGLLGLVIDSGYAYLAASQLQIAADAAALAAAAQLRSTGDTSVPIAKAKEIALLNTAAAKTVFLYDSDVVCGRYYRPGDSTDQLGFYPAETPLNAVQVTARRISPDGVPLFFGHIFSVSTVDVTRSAIAMTASKAPGLIVLDPTGRDALLTGGSIVLNVEDGPVQVNSSNHYAVYFKDNAQIICSELDIVGKNPGWYGSTGAPLPKIVTGVTAIPDPLAGLPVPPNGPLGTRNDDTRTFTPGYFPNGIHIGDSPGKPWTFQPGLYIVDQGNSPPVGFSIGGRNCTVNGDGVTIVVNTGKLSISDAATVNFTPPTSGDYAGICLISFFQAAEGATASIGGQSHVHIKGLIYVPHGLTKIGGSYTDSDATQIICYRLQLVDAVHVSVPLGPRAGGTGHSFLVK